MLKYWWLIGGSIVVVLTFVAATMDFRHTDNYIKRQFRKKAYSPTFANFQTPDGKTIHYWGINLEQTDKPTLLFIHGAPGSSYDFINYMLNDTLVAKFRLITVDRLGYGYSEFGQAHANIEQQAQAISMIFERHPSDKGFYIVGHSYGCAVACYLLANYPTLVRQGILVAPVIDPKHEKVFAISHWVKHKWLQALVPQVWNVANTEKLQHANELQKMSNIWGQIKQTVFVLHGEKDWIAPIDNATFAEQYFTAANLRVFRYAKLDHFIPFTQPHLITQILLNNQE